jgi:secondary thiamine-phosphate synthase enzyme
VKHRDYPHQNSFLFFRHRYGMLQKVLSCPTGGEGDIIDLTGNVSQLVAESGITQGICSVFVPGSTAAVTTAEYEPGVLKDLIRSMEGIAPSDIRYAHNTSWGDGNGRSHVRAALLGPSLTVPVRDGTLALGTWQQIVLVELDTRERKDRTIMVTIIGE